MCCRIIAHGGSPARAQPAPCATSQTGPGTRVCAQGRDAQRPQALAVLRSSQTGPDRPDLAREQGPDLIYPEKGKVYATRGRPKPCLPWCGHPPLAPCCP